MDAVRSGFAWKRFAWRIVIPTVLAAALFVLTIFAVIVPIFRDSLMERKREMIRELINSAWSILDDTHRQELAGLISRPEAQDRAKDRIASLRYGKERKDYFWITDLHPKMVMHPYRADLNGADLTDFADVRGRRLFVESVRLARERGEGFVEYYWQWNDNPERLVPKQSFVRLFEPWGWIIGTGIYLDDVHAEIDRLTYRLLAWCLGITAVISLLLGYITRESMRIERRRLAAEDDLRQSHEKYAALVQASSEGTMMVLDGRCVFANPTIAQMLGYSASEMTALSLEELLPTDANASVISRVRSLLDGDPTPASLELTFAAREGVPVRVLASISRVALAGKSGFILVARDLSHPHPIAGSSMQLPDDPVLEELRASLLFLSEPLGSVLSSAPRCDLGTRIIDAARMMGGEPGGVLTVTSGEHGPVIGIVTDQDLRERVLLERIPVTESITRVMSSPVLALPDSAPVHEALSLMRQHGISHLGVRDERGEIVGIVKDAQLLQFHRFSSTALASLIRTASSVKEIAEVRSRLPRLVRALLDAGARPRNVNRIATRLSDAVSLRLVELAIEELGPAPGPFCFLALGSEGRGEQTLATDQDNALLYIDPAHHDYFLKLGGRVCAALDQAGYAFCKGENMARNPRYCRSLSEWIGQFRSWIAAANPQDLLDFSIFFDFRCVAGEPTLARDLRVSVRHALAEHPPFFLHMANSILAMRTPVGWFGRLALESRPDHPHALNLKDAMLPMVSFARLYALRQGIDATNTLDRIEQLATLQVLRRDFADELIQGYTFLMQLRLQRQASDIAGGKAPDNLLDPASLTPMEQSALRQALNVMTSLRKKVSYDFLGMA
jgi:PAS domain S-box-containing protein